MFEELEEVWIIQETSSTPTRKYATYARALRREEVNLSTKVIRYEMIEHQTRYASISRKQDQTASIGRLFYRF